MPSFDQQLPDTSRFENESLQLLKPVPLDLIENIDTGKTRKSVGHCSFLENGIPLTPQLWKKFWVSNKKPSESTNNLSSTIIIKLEKSINKTEEIYHKEAQSPEETMGNLPSSDSDISPLSQFDEENEENWNPLEYQVTSHVKDSNAQVKNEQDEYTASSSGLTWAKWTDLKASKENYKISYIGKFSNDSPKKLESVSSEEILTQRVQSTANLWNDCAKTMPIQDMWNNTLLDTPKNVKRNLIHIPPLPETTPDNGFIGQHSQGIGGHYAETLIKKRKYPNRHLF